MAEWEPWEFGPLGWTPGRMNPYEDIKLGPLCTWGKRESPFRGWADAHQSAFRRGVGVDGQSNLNTGPEDVKTSNAER